MPTTNPIDRAHKMTDNYREALKMINVMKKITETLRDMEDLLKNHPNAKLEEARDALEEVEMDLHPICAEKLDIPPPDGGEFHDYRMAIRKKIMAEGEPCPWCLGLIGHSPKCPW